MRKQIVEWGCGAGHYYSALLPFCRVNSCLVKPQAGGIISVFVKTTWNVILPVVLMFTLALTRLPGLMPENFSAVYALMFCAGVYFPARMAWWLPMLTLAATDLILNLFFYKSAGTVNFLAMAAFLAPNYLAYAGLIWLGRKFTARASWLSLLCGGVMGALMFYFVTNTSSWIQNPEYSKSLAGWIQALTVGTAGWPHTWEFFRNTLISGGLFTGLFAGAMKISASMEPEEEEKKEPEKSEEPEEGKA